MSPRLSHWRPALRMARRDLRRHPWRALLTCVLVALPVVVGTVAALASYNARWDPARETRAAFGAADAQVLVSGYAAVRPKPALSLEARPATFTDATRREPLRRDRRSVDLADLLPAGSDLVPQVDLGTVELGTGGSAAVYFTDLGSPVATSQAGITRGRAPAGPDEVALPGPAAAELGLLDDDGAPSPGATLDLADGTVLSVVGVSEVSEYAGGGDLTLVAPLDSVLRRSGRDVTSYLVGLPSLTRLQVQDLAVRLNAAGVLFRPVDAALHPAAWGLRAETDAGGHVAASVAGALVVLVGLLEVVLLVGAAFAVAARRQVRDLGLLAVSGGAAADVRRVLLAQGLVLGVGSSLVGVAVGTAVFLGLPGAWGFAGVTPGRDEVDPLALAAVAVLGASTSVVAALLPSWSIGRLTPVAALSGRFPVREGEARAHRGAFVLAGAGLVLLAVGGWTTARTFGRGGQEVSLAPAVAGLGLILLVAGVVWAAPYVVRRVAAAGNVLPLTGRYAFRDAGRHRFRTAAATTALTVTVGAAVLAGFAFSSVARHQKVDGYLPANSLQVYSDTASSPETVAALGSTVAAVVGDPVDTLASFTAVSKERPRAWVTVSGEESPRVVDEDTLRRLVADDATAVAAFRDGAVVLVGGRGRTTEVTVRTGQGKRADRQRVPAVRVDQGLTGTPGRIGSLGRALLSDSSAARLGLAPRGAEVVVLASEPFTSDDVSRLRVYGIQGWSDDPSRLGAERMQFLGLAAAGLLSLLVVGVSVALAAAESRDDVATLAAVGAGPWQRRSLGAVHGLFLGVVGGGLGVLVGVPAGMALTQLDGLRGVDVPWLATLGTLLVVLVAAPAAGWLVTPSRLAMTRRSG